MADSPKLGKRIGSPTWFSHGAVLSENARREMAKALGFDPNRPEEWNGEIFLRAQYCLGFYPGGVQALDNAPRPTDYVQTFKRIREKTIDLVNYLTSLSEFYRDQYSLEVKTGEGGISEIEMALARLFDASRALEMQFKAEPSTGRPKGIALSHVILGLRKTFRKYYKGSRKPRKINGASESLADWEHSELIFVETALNDAAIPFRGLRRLFRSDRCTPVEDATQQ